MSPTPSKADQPAKQNVSVPVALVEAGQPAPDFFLPDQHGKTHRLQDYQGQWVVLYFYPRDDTSGCTKEACQFRDSLPRFQKNRAVVLGVSPDDSSSHARFAAKHELPFALLADQGAQVCALYGVWREKSMYGRKYMGVVRTTYLIDPQGRVARRFDKVSVAGHEEEILAAIQSFQ